MEHIVSPESTVWRPQPMRAVRSSGTTRRLGRCASRHACAFEPRSAALIRTGGPMKTAIAVSREVDPQRAADDLAEQLRTKLAEPAAVMLFAAPAYDHEVLLKRLSERTGESARSCSRMRWSARSAASRGARTPYMRAVNSTFSSAVSAEYNML